MLWFFLIVDIIMSAAALLGGYYMKFVAPKDKEMKMGVLTESAKKSQNTWEYANKTCGKGWIGSGIAGLVLSAAATETAFFASEKVASIVGAAAAVVIVIAMSCSVTVTMLGLRSKFDEKGEPLEKE